MTATLSSFRIKRDRDGFVVRVEDDKGDMTELSATYDQLDTISEAIDEQLAFGDVDLEPDDEESKARSSDRKKEQHWTGGDYVAITQPGPSWKWTACS